MNFKTYIFSRKLYLCMYKMIAEMVRRIGIGLFGELWLCGKWRVFGGTVDGGQKFHSNNIR